MGIYTERVDTAERIASAIYAHIRTHCFVYIFGTCFGLAEGFERM